MYGSAPDLITIDLANALLFTAYAVTWTGARVFDDRPAEPVYLMTGAVLWLLVCHLSVLADAIEVRLLVSTGIIATYSWLTAYEFWRGRSEVLVSRWAAIFVLFAQGSLVLLRTPLIALLPPSISSHVYGSALLTAHSFEALLFTIAIAFLLLAMAKERNELRYRTAAMLDPLTGVANRASFMQDAAQLAKCHRAKPRPMAVLAIDLDHFKSINDRFGHAFGDRVLKLFVDAARQSVCSTDLLGRLGGDEFAVVLSDAARDKAMAVADRIRTKFCAGRFRGRQPPDRRHHERRACPLPGWRLRRARASGAGRSGALSRQGQRAQSDRDRIASYDAQSQRRLFQRLDEIGVGGRR